MKTNGKKRNNAGFSLAETLAALLILLMVSAIVAAGLPMAREAYEKAVDGANAQTLLTATTTALRAELCEASNVETTEDGTNTLTSFRSARTRASTKLGSPEDGCINILDFADVTGSEARPLVSEAMAKNRLRTAFDAITYESGTGVFTVVNLCVMRGETCVVALGDFTIKTVNP